MNKFILMTAVFLLILGTADAGQIREGLMPNHSLDQNTQENILSETEGDLNANNGYGIVKELSDSALRHGNQQVQNMLKDRPAMSKYITKDGVEKYITEKDSVWQWAARKFAGEDLDNTIDWNPDPPEKAAGMDADHRIPWENRRGFIRVREEYSTGQLKGGRRSFEDLWASACFELLNISDAKNTERLFQEALRGKLSKEEYIDRNIEREFEVEQELKQFYRNIWVVWANKNNFSIDPKSRFQNIMLKFPHSYDVFKKKIYKSKSYKSYLDYWNNYYDQSIAPYKK